MKISKVRFAKIIIFLLFEFVFVVKRFIFLCFVLSLIQNGEINLNNKKYFVSVFFLFHFACLVRIT